MRNEINNLKQKSGEMKNKNEKLEQELSNLRDQMKKLKIVSNLFFLNTFDIFLRNKKNTRTDDLFHTGEVLYLLSYRVLHFSQGFNTPSPRGGRKSSHAILSKINPLVLKSQ